MNPRRFGSRILQDEATGVTVSLVSLDDADLCRVADRRDLLARQQPRWQAPIRDREMQRDRMEGWTAARALAPKGGAVELLGPVNVRLQARSMRSRTRRRATPRWRSARRCRAAQEERDEMALLLAHARDLSNQMALIGAPAQWPLPIDELEGELWFEVDRFTEARDAYERATKLKPTPNAWIGLARASDRLGDVVTACAPTPGRIDAGPADVGRARDLALRPEVQI